MLISKQEPYHLIEGVCEYIHLSPLFTFVMITATVKAQYKIFNNVEMPRKQETESHSHLVCTYVYSFYYKTSYFPSCRSLVVVQLEKLREREREMGQVLHWLILYTLRHSASGRPGHHLLPSLICIQGVLY